MTMSAENYDDPEEGGNADIVYTIEKNEVEEETGLLIFEIDSSTGAVRTTVCCLDRERTPDYVIQVVAVDGGGLKVPKVNHGSAFSALIALMSRNLAKNPSPAERPID
ncbi:hypothetical protein J6590_099717 [Homalodisca vitripennis]|nr:hypothetical protein J6590_099717 [Homalodisca vitripennis]